MKEFLVLKIDVERNELKERIKKRIVDRIENEDMIEEVSELHEQGLSWKKLESFGLEYKFVSKYLQNKLGQNAREYVFNNYSRNKNVEKLNCIINNFIL